MKQNEAMPYSSVVGIKNVAELENILQQHSITNPLLVDLTRGAWYPHQIAHTLATQLDITLPINNPTGGGKYTKDFISYSNIIGQSIDAEATGDKEALKAFEYAVQLAPIIANKPIVIFIPNSPSTWRRSNKLFLKYLSNKNDFFPLFIEYNITKNSDKPLPSLHPIDFFPGLIPKYIVKKVPRAAYYQPFLKNLSAYYALSDISQVLAIKTKQAAYYDQLAAFTQHDCWAWAYTQVFGNNLFVEALRLAEIGWKAFFQDDIDLAQVLLLRAVECTRTPVEKAISYAYLQGFYIATQQFTQAATLPLPPNDIDSALRHFLIFSKAWALTMIGEMQKAETYYQSLIKKHKSVHSNKHEDTRNNEYTDIEYLYLLNIYALCKVKQGNIQQAMELEKSIEYKYQKNITNDNLNDYRIYYINCINLARLYRHQGDHKSSRYYYYRAFSTNKGIRSPSEIIHYNVIVSSIYESENNEAKAKNAFLRASLHWLAYPTPEALGIRAIEAIIGSKNTDNLVEDISTYFLTHLARYGLHVEKQNTYIPHTLYSYTHTRTNNLVSLGEDGWNILLDLKKSTSSLQLPVDTTAYLHLHQTLTHFIVKIMRFYPDLQGRSFSIYIDRNHGSDDLTKTFPDALTQALLLELQTVYFSKHVINMGKPLVNSLQASLSASLATIVDDLYTLDNVVYVVFKRHLSPQVLSKQEEEILSLINKSCLVRNWGNLPNNIWKILKTMQKNHIITLSLSEESCIMDGIK